MLSRVSVPKSKAELIRALQKASFRSFEIYEGTALSKLPVGSLLARTGDTAIVLKV